MEEKKENNIPEPRITLFGEDVNAQDNGKVREEKKKESKGEHKNEWRNGCNCGGHRDHRNRCCCGGGAWGLAVLLSGSVLLFNALGLIPWEFWQFVWPFWPAFLILAGIKILLGCNWFSAVISFFLAAALFGSVIVYGLIHVDSPFVDQLPSEVVNFVNNFNQPNK